MKVQSNSKSAKTRQLKAKSRQFSFSLRNFGCAMVMFPGGCMFCHRGMANNLQGCQRLRTPRISVLGPQLWLRLFPMKTIWCSFRRVLSGNFTQLSNITIVAGKTHYRCPFFNSYVKLPEGKSCWCFECDWLFRRIFELFWDDDSSWLAKCHAVQGTNSWWFVDAMSNHITTQWS